MCGDRSSVSFRPSLWVERSVGSLIVGAAVLMLLVTGTQADEVLVKDKNGKTVTRKGEVVDFKNRILTLRVGSREQTIPGRSIERIQSEWNADHLQADVAFERFLYEEALGLYRSAFRDEPRRWVKRKILSHVVFCQRNTGRTVEACKNFARLVADDPHTQYFDAIPLMWDDRSVSRDPIEQISAWLQASNPPAERLMAASWLLRSNQKIAVQALRELGRESWEPVAHLAIAQLCRLELRNMKPTRVAWWEQHVNSMSPELRAGGYFMLGRAYQLHGTVDQVALAFLRLPMQYPHQRALSNAALFQCAQSLQEAGRTDEAMHCYATIGSEGGYAELARERLNAMRN